MYSLLFIEFALKFYDDKKKNVIRSLLCFFIGFFFGNGGVIKGEFTQTLYDVFDFFIQNSFSFTFFDSESFDFKTIYQHIFQASSVIPDENKETSLVSLNKKVLSQNGFFFTDFFDSVPTFHFFNLFFVFFLFESINFSFFATKKKMKQSLNWSEFKVNTLFEQQRQIFVTKDNKKSIEITLNGTQSIFINASNLHGPVMNTKKTQNKEQFVVGKNFFQQNLVFLNPVKLGFLFGLFVDAFKVGS